MRRYLGIIFELLLLFFAIVAIFLFSPKQKKISAVPHISIPPQSQVALSGPLDLRSLDSRILGISTGVDPQEVIDAANRRRQEVGLAKLKINDILMKTAKLRADVIVRYQHFSHHDPNEGIELATVLPRYGYYFSYAAENIGMGGVSGEDFIRGFFNSSSHREAILNPSFMETGVGIAKGNFNNWETLVVVQHFAIASDERTWFGYTKEDIIHYQELLSQIRINLENTNKWLAQTGGKSSYYRNWKEILERQEYIIARLLFRIEKKEPFSQYERGLIHEYNSNWEKAAKS